MFLDTTVDSVLKGLGEQVYTMKVNIIDAAICFVFVVLLVPKMGIYGYVTVIYVSEAVNATLSILRMQKITGLRLRFSLMLVPFLFVAASYSAVNVTEMGLLYGAGITLSTVGKIILFGVIYVGISVIYGGFGVLERKKA